MKKKIIAQILTLVLILPLTFVMVNAGYSVDSDKILIPYVKNAVEMAGLDPAAADKIELIQDESGENLIRYTKTTGTEMLVYGIRAMKFGEDSALVNGLESIDSIYEKQLADNEVSAFAIGNSDLVITMLVGVSTYKSYNNAFTFYRPHSVSSKWYSSDATGLDFWK